ncbi:hypothetical protein ACFQ41_10580 [Lacticaseibacillus suilingensis]|uniref:Uncharacterized protein n=1 Tax=Lacticaseibacillus suilingensis TaxID=2799577 RepID=A0ABW4BGZ0_9LACO|nr:hypothetical protein [Lacticaseibacillus suilingensis]
MTGTQSNGELCQRVERCLAKALCRLPTKEVVLTAGVVARK